MNYKIIQNEEVLKDFINNALPELLPHETFYVTLFARKKYCDFLKSDKCQLKRFTSSKDYLFGKIKQLECEIGSYTQDGVEIPNDALALYITVNPRSFIRATKQSLKKLLDLVLMDNYNGFNPQQEVMSQIQKAQSRKVYFEADFDGVELESTLEEVYKCVNKDCVTIVITRGGFHVLIEFSKMDKKYEKTWYNSIIKIPGIDIKGENLEEDEEDGKGKGMLLPIPGTIQGGFTVKLKKNE